MLNVELGIRYNSVRKVNTQHSTLNNKKETFNIKI